MSEAGEIKLVNDMPVVLLEIEKHFNGFMRSTLIEIENLLPHSSEKDENAVKYQNMRRIILRQGNDRVRVLREFMKDFAAAKIYESKKILVAGLASKGKGE